MFSVLVASVAHLLEPIVVVHHARAVLAKRRPRCVELKRFVYLNT